jgi:hypothetical protein
MLFSISILAISSMKTDASLTNGASCSSQPIGGYEYYVDRDDALRSSSLPFLLPTMVAAAFWALPGSNGLVHCGMMEHFHLDLPPIQLGWTMLSCRSPARTRFHPKTAAP